jgi:hypothetical protein
MNSYPSFKAQLKYSFIGKAISDIKTWSDPSFVIPLHIILASIIVRSDIQNIQQLVV